MVWFVAGRHGGKECGRVAGSQCFATSNITPDVMVTCALWHVFVGRTGVWGGLKKVYTHVSQVAACALHFS
jgi:hypothetical protein